MSMGRRERDRQPAMWVTTTALPTAASHPSYRRPNELLREHGFDDFVETQCADFYAETMGRPGLPPGIYFRLLLIGDFEGIDSERGIAWRAAPRHLYRHDSADFRCVSFGPPVPGDWGTAHVGTPSRGSSQACSTHQTANAAITVNALSTSALLFVSIEESPHTLTGALADGVRQQYRRCLYEVQPGRCLTPLPVLAHPKPGSVRPSASPPARHPRYEPCC